MKVPFIVILFLPLFSFVSPLIFDKKSWENSLERFQRVNEAFDLRCLRMINGEKAEKVDHQQQQQLNETSTTSKELGNLLPSTGNIFISSFSISSVLMMALAGARGDTQQALLNLLGIESLEEKADMQSAYRDLIISQTTTVKNDSSDIPLWNIANSIVVDKSFPLYFWYLEIIAAFEAKVFQEDFRSELGAEKAVKEINAWISQHTGGKIGQLFDPNGAGQQQLSQIKLLLLSAVYFKSAWKWKFPENKTEKADFFTSSQSSTTTTAKQVEMMHLRAPLRYARSGGSADSESSWELLELPYQNRSFQSVFPEFAAKQLAMYVFLPSSSKSNKSALQRYSLHKLSSLIEQLSSYPEVVVQLPKFHLKTEYSLRKPLEPWLGDTAFSPSRANFSWMIQGGEANNTDPRLHISEIKHKAVISVDEEGSEAAAVTDIEIVHMPPPGLPPPPPPHFIANRPFVFVIREMDTSAGRKGVIFFSGVVNDP